MRLVKFPHIFYSETLLGAEIDFKNKAYLIK